MGNRVLPFRGSEIKGMRGLDTLESPSFQNSPVAERRDGIHGLEQRTQDYQLAIQMGIEQRNAGEQRLFKAELHQHQNDREGDAGYCSDQPALFVHQLQPGEWDSLHFVVMCESEWKRARESELVMARFRTAGS